MTVTEIGRAFEDGTINFPAASKLLGCDPDSLPYFIVGDEIFPLKAWVSIKGYKWSN